MKRYPQADDAHHSSSESEDENGVGDESLHHKTPFTRVLVDVRSLEDALRTLSGSNELNRIGHKQIKLFWSKDLPLSRIISDMTLSELASMNAQEMVQVRGVGRQKVQGLIDAMRYAVAHPDNHRNAFSDRPGISDEVETLLQLQEELKKSPTFEKIAPRRIGDYWPGGRRRAREFAEMTFGALVAADPVSMVSMEGVGVGKLQGLCEAAQRALIRYQSKDPTSLEQPVQSMQSIESEVLASPLRKLVERFVEESRRAISSKAQLGILQHELASILSLKELAVLLCLENLRQREVGEILGVTESRISQLVGAAHEKIRQLGRTVVRDLDEQWRGDLARPAVSEQLLMAPFRDSSLDAQCQVSAGIVYLRAMGACHPTIHGHRIKTHWTTEPGELEAKVVALVDKLPMSHDVLMTELRGLLPGVDDDALQSILGELAFKVDRLGVWVHSHREALYWVLASRGSYMSAAELADMTGVSQRMIRVILRDEPRVEKVGFNRSRRYRVMAQDLPWMNGRRMEDESRKDDLRETGPVPDAPVRH